MEVGDRIKVQGMTGLVVALISEGKFAESRPAEQWAYLKVGALIMTDEAGLITTHPLMALMSRRLQADTRPLMARLRDLHGCNWSAI